VTCKDAEVFVDQLPRKCTIHGTQPQPRHVALVQMTVQVICKGSFETLCRPIWR